MGHDAQAREHSIDVDASERTDEQAGELATLTAEAQRLETDFQAALLADPDRTETTETVDAPALGSPGLDTLRPPEPLDVGRGPLRHVGRERAHPILELDRARESLDIIHRRRVSAPRTVDNFRHVSYSLRMAPNGSRFPPYKGNRNRGNRSQPSGTVPGVGNRSRLNLVRQTFDEPVALDSALVCERHTLPAPVLHSREQALVEQPRARPGHVRVADAERAR